MKSRREFLGGVGIGAGAAVLAGSVSAQGPHLTGSGWITVRSRKPNETDDTLAVEEALKSARDSHGGIIFFSPREYFLSRPIELDSNDRNLSFVGVGWLASKIHFRPSPETKRRYKELKRQPNFINTRGVDPTTGTGASDITVQGLYIDNLDKENLSNAICAEAPCRWCVVRNVINGFGGESILFKGGLQSVIEMNEIWAGTLSPIDAPLFYGGRHTPGAAIKFVPLHPERPTNKEHGTTMRTVHNYIHQVGGKENSGWGIWCENSPYQSLFMSDIVEYAWGAIKFENITDYTVMQLYAEALFPYAEWPDLYKELSKKEDKDEALEKMIRDQRWRYIESQGSKGTIITCHYRLGGAGGVGIKEVPPIADADIDKHPEWITAVGCEKPVAKITPKDGEKGSGKPPGKP